MVISCFFNSLDLIFVTPPPFRVLNPIEIVETELKRRRGGGGIDLLKNTIHQDGLYERYTGVRELYGCRYVRVRIYILHPP